MGVFQSRLGKAVSRYRQQQRMRDDGGWGERPYKGEPSSIVNTVQVLAVLRAAGVPYKDEAVERGLQYLADAVIAHPRPKPGEGAVTSDARGMHTRYLAWGISGLTLFKASRHDPRLLPAQEHCIDWLAEHECKASRGAWGEVPGAEHPSLLSTSAAISGLARVCPYTAAGPTAAGLVERARFVVYQLADVRQTKRAETAFWRLHANAAGGGGSPSATAMAVLVLSEGDERQKDYARKGARWLAARPRLWTRKTEGDASVPEAAWQHMTFSLAIRAIVKATRQPHTNALREAVRFMDSLWSDKDKQWLDGKPGADPTPSGAYAVVAAYEAIANAWQFEANRELLHERATDQEREVSDGETLHVYEDRAVLVRDLDGSKVEVQLVPALAGLLVLLAQRWIEGRGSKDLDPKSWDIGQLAEARNLRPSSVERYVRDINREFRSAGAEKRREVLPVAELRKSTTTPGERVLLIVEKVELHLS